MTADVSLVLIGDELLLGHVVDGNAAWLGRRLDDAGLRVVSSSHAADDLDAVVRAVRRGLQDASAVVVTGGLGPTSDDVTREALARLAGVPLRRDPGVEQALRAWYAARGEQVPDLAPRMADLPVGAQALGNGVGSAPGVRVEVGDGVVLAVPGVPGEMRAMVEAAVLPELLRRAGPLPAVATRSLLVTCLGESLVAERLAPLEAEIGAQEGDAAVAYLAAPAEVVVRLRVTGAPGRHAQAEAVADRLAQRARELLGDTVAAEGGEALAAVLVAHLTATGQTVATAESLTGGLVAAALTDVAGSSAVVRGGVVAYATAAKATLLGVDAGHLWTHGAVDPGTAAAMARGVRERFGSTWGVATTGVAGPDPAEGHPPGTLHVAVAGPTGTRVASPRVRSGRAAARRSSTVHALDLLRRSVAGLGPAAGERPAVGESWGTPGR